MTPSASPFPDTIELAPSYSLPIALVALAVPLLLVKLWIGLVVSLFGVFLLIQAATLRLRFTATDLDIYRGETMIRRFPYLEWQNWQIFWPGVPILFYFKEVNSIHFLPILFDPKTLKETLESKIPLSANSVGNRK